ncbi:MAG: DUF1330 domain-containing protein [Acidimicrobiales bacterium]
MTAYLIVNYDIDDAELYGDYQGGAGPALRIGTECQLLVLEGASTVLEGSPGQQTVVLEFEDKDKAREIYESGEYQAVIGKRHQATSNHFAVLVDKFG